MVPDRTGQTPVRIAPRDRLRQSRHAAGESGDFLFQKLPAVPDTGFSAAFHFKYPCKE